MLPTLVALSLIPVGHSMGVRQQELDLVRHPISIHRSPLQDSFVVQTNARQLIRFGLDDYDGVELVLSGETQMELQQDDVAISPKGDWVASVEATGSSEAITTLMTDYMDVVQILYGMEDGGKLNFNSDGTLLRGLGQRPAICWRLKDGKTVSRIDRDWENGFDYPVPGTRGSLIIDQSGRVTKLNPAERNLPKLSKWTYEDGTLFSTPEGLRAIRGQELIEVPSKRVVRPIRVPSELVIDDLFSPRGLWYAGRSESKTRMFVVPLGGQAGPPPLVGNFRQNSDFLSDKCIALMGDDVEFYDLPSGTLMLTLRADLTPLDRTPYPDMHQWAAWTPDGTYTGSEQCLKWMSTETLKRRDDKAIGRIVEELLDPIK